MDKPLTEHNAFVACTSALLVAPAGYGKTFSIVECLKISSGRQLVLTHTHAAVAVLRERIKEELDIPSSRYQIETISSFLQRYVAAFLYDEELPAQESQNELQSFVLRKGVDLFASKHIRDILKLSYEGIFVDEYQDCTKSQNSILKLISSALPIRLVGDHLQGIYNFGKGDALVNFEEDLKGFEKFDYLKTPHRWNQKDNNPALGKFLVILRERLLNNEPITLEQNSESGIFILNAVPADLLKPKSTYSKWLRGIIENPNNDPDLDNLLIIVPQYIESLPLGKQRYRGGVGDRAKLKSRIDAGNRLTLLEAIDDKSFYSSAKAIDELLGQSDTNKINVPAVKKLLYRHFNKTDIDKWINKNGLVKKKDHKKQDKAEDFKADFTTFFVSPSHVNLLNLIAGIRNKLKCKSSRQQLLFSIMRALEEASSSKTSVLDAMILQKNKLRRHGRRINEKCLGTTLLTKGLEFNTVVVLDADQISCKKNFYVALTRAKKKLIVVTAKNTLSFL